MAQLKNSSLQQNDLTAALRLAITAVTEVGGVLKDNYGKSDYTTKAHANDWVTRWDKWAEEQIVPVLESFDSTIGIVAEEGSNKSGNQLYWTVDPIDGTVHFVNGVAKCTSMVALVENEVPIAGVIYDFIDDAVYTAAAGLGAYKELTKKLSVNNGKLHGAALEYSVHLPKLTDDELRKYFAEQGVTLVENYASGYAGILAATGQIDGMFYAGTSPPNVWDIAPVAILVSEAGGTVTNLESDEYKLGRNCFVNGSDALVADISQLHIETIN